MEPQWCSVTPFKFNYLGTLLMYHTWNFNSQHFPWYCSNYTEKSSHSSPTYEISCGRNSLSREAQTSIFFQPYVPTPQARGEMQPLNLALGPPWDHLLRTVPKPPQLTPFVLRSSSSESVCWLSFAKHFNHTFSIKIFHLRIFKCNYFYSLTC